jgi:hypothetical protein
VSNHQRRLKTIELTLTPRQIVLLWLKQAQKENYLQGSLKSPSPREYVANAVGNTVRKGMKGGSEQIIEMAIEQARKEADLLYLLVIDANGWVLGRNYEYKQSLMLTSGHLRAVGQALAHQVSGGAELLSRLRVSLTLVLENLLTDEEACSRITSDRLEGQDVLFPDVRAELNLRIQGAKKQSECFDEMAAYIGEAALDWEQVRAAIQPVVDERVSECGNVAQLHMLLAFGKGEAWREPGNRILVP